MKRIITAVLLLMCALTLAAFGAFRVFSANCEDVCGDVLRLHIPANSDGEEDQAVKLELRDVLLEKYGSVLAECDGLDSAKQRVRELLPEIERTANVFLLERGFDYGAKAELCEMWFSTREYDRLILPAGNYTALRVTLGSGEGHNWWCVIFPQLCLPAVSEREEPDPPDNEAEQVLETFGKPQKVTVKFALFEWLTKLFA